MMAQDDAPRCEGCGGPIPDVEARAAAEAVSGDEWHRE